MSQEYYIIFVGKNPVFFASVQKIHVAVSLHESQKIFVVFGSIHAPIGSV